MKRILQKSHSFGKIKHPSYEGEPLEHKISRIVENKEPITDGAPMIYTEKKDGVLPQYNIRVDKWELALDAMDKVNREKIAKGQAMPEDIKKDEENVEKPADGGETNSSSSQS